MNKYVDLEPEVLKVFLEYPEEGHFVHDLVETTGLNSGQMYTVLARLETRGLISSDWAAPHEHGAPRRRIYKLTSYGRLSATRPGQ